MNLGIMDYLYSNSEPENSIAYKVEDGFWIALSYIKSKAL